LTKEEDVMEIVRIPEVHELAAEDQPFLEATKGWFKIDFVPKMSRVRATRSSSRATGAPSARPSPMRALIG
jgi:hypothetical protein